MKNIFFISIVSVVFFSCSKKEACYLDYFEKAIIFPENYEIVDCSPDIYDIAVHFKFKEESIKDFIVKNNFKLFTASDQSNSEGHKNFIYDMKSYFNIEKPVNIDGTYFFKTVDDKKNYLNCLVTKEGNFYGLIEKGVSLPPEWSN